MPLVFRTARRRAGHFSDHGADFGATDEMDYEQMADAFLGCPLPTDCEERFRGDGSRIRFNLVTHHFGIVSVDGFIQTYYIPDPLVHQEASNYDYYLTR